MGWLNILSDTLYDFLYKGIKPARYWRKAPGVLNDQHMSRNHMAFALVLDMLVFGDDPELRRQLDEMIREPMGDEGEPLAGYLPHWLFAFEALRRDRRMPEGLRTRVASWMGAAISWLVAHMTPEGPIVDGGRVYESHDNPDTPYDEDALLDAYAQWSLKKAKTESDLFRYMAHGERKRWQQGAPDKPWRALYLMVKPPHWRAYRPQTRSLNKIRTIKPYWFIQGAHRQFASAWPEGLDRVPSHMVIAVSYVNGMRHSARPFIAVSPRHGDRPNGYYCKTKAVNVVRQNNRLVCTAMIRPVNRRFEIIPGEDWRPWNDSIPCPVGGTRYVTSANAPPKVA